MSQADDRRADDEPAYPGWPVAQEAFLRSGRLLIGTLTTMLRSRVDAEDAVQEALALLAKNIETIDDHSDKALDKWLRTTAVREAMRKRRGLRRLLPSGSATDIDDAWRRMVHHVPVEDHMAVREAQLFIAAALPQKQRTAYLLRYFLDFTLAKIAEVMKCSEGNVTTHLARAQAKIDQRFGTEPAPVADQTASRLRRRGNEA